MNKIKREDAIIINLVREAVERQGCILLDVDLENYTVKVDGPDERIEHLKREQWYGVAACQSWFLH